MLPRALDVTIGSIRLKNPVIAGSGEHLIEASGIRRALESGASVVVVKSTNEVEAAKDQLDRAEYMVLDKQWRQVGWSAAALDGVTVACRSGLYPGKFEDWLEQAARLDREAARCDSYVAASLILGDLAACEKMARAI